MLKEFVWKAFENTGSIDAYVFYKEIEEKFKTVNNDIIAEGEVAASK